MNHQISKERLISLERRVAAPHVVILGAGASLAALPWGDRKGRRLPLMKNLVEVIGLGPLIADHHPDLHEDFEKLYSTLHSEKQGGVILRTIEETVEGYFKALQLPESPTLYDMILLSLRDKDAVFTFNWDPFLFDSHKRLQSVASLPRIFHLHGNVRIGFCKTCQIEGERNRPCSLCGKAVVPTQLLYPVSKKDYASDPFLKGQWEEVKAFLKKAYYVTIFGYSSPTSDQEAIQLFTDAWKFGANHKHIERLEIIDIRDESELLTQWRDFSHFDHIDVCRSFYESVLALAPRRTCEALNYQGDDGEFLEPIPWAGNLEGLMASIVELTAYEGPAS